MDIKERLKKAFSVPDNWDKHDYQIPRYTFEDLEHAVEIANSSNDIHNVSECESCNGSGLVEGEHFDDLQPCMTCNGRGC